MRGRFHAGRIHIQKHARESRHTTIAGNINRHFLDREQAIKLPVGFETNT